MGKLNKIKDWIIPGDGFEIKKSLNKLVIGIIASVFISIVSYGIEQVELANVDPRYALFIGVGIACLYGAQNAIKHWKDKELEESN